MRRRLIRGISYIEVLITAVIMTGVITMLATSFSEISSMWRMITEYNPSISEHRKVADMIAEHVRNAQGCRNSAAGIKDSAFAYVKASDFAYYTDRETCGTVRYHLSGTNLMRESDGSSTVAAENVTAFSCEWLQSTAYHTQWSPAATTTITSEDELRKLAGVRMSLTTTVIGQPVTSNFTIRLRNSPKKNRLDGLR